MKGETHRSNRIKWEGSRGKHTQNITSPWSDDEGGSGMGWGTRGGSCTRPGTPSTRAAIASQWGGTKRMGRRNVRGGVLRMWSRARCRDERPVRRAATVAMRVRAAFRSLLLSASSCPHKPKRRKPQQHNHMQAASRLFAFCSSCLAWPWLEIAAGGRGLLLPRRVLDSIQPNQSTPNHHAPTGPISIDPHTRLSYNGANQTPIKQPNAHHPDARFVGRPLWPISKF